MDDETLTKSIASDPFHVGLTEHGEFKGFVQPVMTDEDIEESRSKLDRWKTRSELHKSLKFHED